MFANNISEKGLAKSIITRTATGKVVEPLAETEKKENFSASYNAARRMRWDSMLLVQDIIGILGVWKSKAFWSHDDQY